MHFAAETSELVAKQVERGTHKAKNKRASSGLVRLGCWARRELTLLEGLAVVLLACLIEAQQAEGLAGKRREVQCRRTCDLVRCHTRWWWELYRWEGGHQNASW